MTNLINKISKLAMIPILAGSLNGCRDASNDFCKKGKYNGYEVRASFGDRRRVIIDSEIDGCVTEKASVWAVENLADLKDKKRFSQIYIDSEIPLEHQIIKYANLDSLEKIYNYVKENGEDCK